MTLKLKIESDLKAAVKGADPARRDLLRMLKARILEAEVELRVGKGRDYQLSDAEVVDVISRYAKQRKQSIEAYEKAGREDLASRERHELDLLSPYLPKQLSEAEVEAIVREAITESGASSARDIGVVMRLAMGKAAGLADGKTVNRFARQLLQ